MASAAGAGVWGDELGARRAGSRSRPFGRVRFVSSRPVACRPQEVREDHEVDSRPQRSLAPPFGNVAGEQVARIPSPVKAAGLAFAVGLFVPMAFFMRMDVDSDEGQSDG